MPTTVPTSSDHTASAHAGPRIYDDGADDLISGDALDRVSLLPGTPRDETLPHHRLRILWGQDMLTDVIEGRYRTVVCGVNDEDNTHGIISQLVQFIPPSQWNEKAVTSFARMFQQSVQVHAGRDQQPYVLKYDLDRTLILAILRPHGQGYFTLRDLAHGLKTVARMLENRADRLPVCSVSFLGARSNRLIDDDGREPSFETVLRTMHESGFRGDVYPSPRMWGSPEVGVFPHYPFPAGVKRMREGSS